MTSTNETVKEILALPPDGDVLGAFNTNHLQNMARFWLLKSEIEKALENREWHPFTCPECRGHYFGTVWPDGLDGKRREVRCHDQYARGCHWTSETYQFDESIDLLAQIREVEK